MSLVDTWLHDAIRATPTPTRPVLVLCRTNATLHTVRAWAARQRGLPGFEVATPRMLAAQLDGPRLAEPEPSTDDLPVHPFADRIRTRPGLVALARQRVVEARRTLAAAPDTPLPDWLRELAATDWAREKDVEIELLALARTNGARLTASLAWSRVVPLGFEGPLDPWTAALVQAFVGDVPRDRIEGRVPAQALDVPDPVAEARHAARLAAPAPDDTLVLVQHAATAARVHRALLRNGIPSAWRGAVRLERHTLAAVIRRGVPWFSGALDPAVRAVDLHEVLRHPLLGQRLPPPAREWLGDRLEALGEPRDATWLSPRDLTAAIKRARHLDAPLSRWIDTLDALQARDDEDRTPARSARLQARLMVLKATVTGVPFTEVFGTDAPEDDDDWGDFDALVSSLIGDDLHLPRPLAETGTLGALRRFLLACQVLSGDDPAALRILGALRKAQDRPATRLEALQCLIGQVERAECRGGVEIIAYEDYDGRPSGQLILCDVHDQGVAARPRPDPLLSDAQLRAMGQLDTRERVRHRLDQLRRATAHSQAATALVSRHDTMGRVVVAPVQLALAFEPVRTAPYGLDVPLPAVARTRSLAVVDADPTPPPDDPVGRLAVQATAEWVRAGRGPIGAAPVADDVPGPSTLAHLLAERPTPPDWVGPYVGRVQDTPEAHLADGERSATGFFTPLTHCLYQAFAKTVLGIREPDTLSEELDARQIGHAVHTALEHAAPQGGWGHEGEDQAVAAAFRKALREHNTAAFATAREEYGALSVARDAATRGLEERWATHWDRWAASRTVRAGRGDDRAPHDELLRQHVHLDRAKQAFTAEARRLDLPPLGKWALSDWLPWICQRNLDDPAMHRDELLMSHDRNGLPGAYEDLARRFLGHPSLRAYAHTLRVVDRLRAAMVQPTFGVVAELPFGTVDGEAVLHIDNTLVPVAIGPIDLPLGRTTVRVRGLIDRVLLVGLRAEPLLRVTDYKSGGGAPNTRNGLKRLLQLIDPQLVIYALVLREALRTGRLPDAFARADLATVGWDHLRATVARGEQLHLSDPMDRFLLDDATLDLLGRAIGSLVGRATAGDWPLSPRRDTCPKLSAYGHDHCAYADACRLRALPEVTR
jgi:hypothetical protein